MEKYPESTVLEEIIKDNPGNRCVKYLSDAKVQKGFENLNASDKLAFLKCINTGIKNPDSGLGCYAMPPSDYETFGFFFDKVIGDYHKNDPTC